MWYLGRYLGRCILYQSGYMDDHLNTLGWVSSVPGASGPGDAHEKFMLEALMLYSKLPTWLHILYQTLEASMSTYLAGYIALWITDTIQRYDGGPSQEPQYPYMNMNGSQHTASTTLQSTFRSFYITQSTADTPPSQCTKAVSTDPPCVRGDCIITTKCIVHSYTKHKRTSSKLIAIISEVLNKLKG